jgi:hypothetical protein
VRSYARETRRWRSLSSLIWEDKELKNVPLRVLLDENLRVLLPVAVVGLAYVLMIEQKNFKNFLTTFRTLGNI